MSNRKIAGIDPSSPLAKGNEFELALSVADLKKIVKNRTRYIDLNPTEAYEQLSEGNKRALSHLVNVAKILNEVFLKQDHPDNIRAKEVLEEEAAKGTPGSAEALALFSVFNGLEGRDMYAKKSEPLNLFKNKSTPPGKGFYPSDVTKEEIVAYLQAHPEQIAAILANNTMVFRDGDRFVSMPYSVAFRKEMDAAAHELMCAAVTTDHKGFADYLRWQAQALVNDSDPEAVFMAERGWINLKDSPLEFTIGRESYEDSFSGEIAADPKIDALIKVHGIKAKQKDTIGIRVGIVNDQSKNIIESYRESLKEFKRRMPLKEYYEGASEKEEEQNITYVDVDIVALGGECAAIRNGMLGAQNLPNPDKLSFQLGEGSRLVFHRQTRTNYFDPVAYRKFYDSIVAPEQKKLYNEVADLRFLIGHELGHSFGPDKTKDGRDIKTALGIYGNILEENKADMVSLSIADFLCEQGKFSAEQANEVYLTWAVGQLPQKQPVETEVHRFREVLQLNYFREKGAIVFEEGGSLSVVPSKMIEAAPQMLEEIVSLQLEGDRQKAQAFTEKYAVWNEALQYAADEQIKLHPRLYRLLKQPFKDKGAFGSLGLGD